MAIDTDIFAAIIYPVFKNGETERPRYPNGIPMDLTAEEAIDLMKQMMENMTGIHPDAGKKLSPTVADRQRFEDLLTGRAEK